MDRNFIAIKKEFTTKAKCKSLIKTLDKITELKDIIAKLSRVLAFQLYLSDHNCGTQFMNGEYVESDIGKAVLFPAYFTHTHRGQACPQKKTRYLITGYFNFI